MNFIQLHDLPILNLDTCLTDMLQDELVSWHNTNHQICLNTVPGEENNYSLGCGSLVWDWDNAREIENDDGSKTLDVPRFEIEKQEQDFTVLCRQFVDTPFELAYRKLERKYHLGRVRIMRSNPKTCLTWHVDRHPRVHYPIKTQEGCIMVIDDRAQHLPKDTWWFTNTLSKHTAFNGSGDIRIHLVATIISER